MTNLQTDYIVLWRQWYNIWVDATYDLLWISKEIEEKNRLKDMEVADIEWEYVAVKRDCIKDRYFTIDWSFEYEDRAWVILPLSLLSELK